MLRTYALLASTLTLVACGGTYCQSGNKSGTECYSPADLDAHERAQGRQSEPRELGNFWNQAPPPTAMPATLPPPTSASARPPPAPSSADAGTPPQ